MQRPATSSPGIQSVSPGQIGLSGIITVYGHCPRKSGAYRRAPSLFVHSMAFSPTSRSHPCITSSVESDRPGLYSTVPVAGLVLATIRSTLTSRIQRSGRGCSSWKEMHDANACKGHLKGGKTMVAAGASAEMSCPVPSVNWWLHRQRRRVRHLWAD